ncbi:sugar ABC transporter ATP-binding protein [Oceanithermus sp.]|uniref:sugar ABC transporter ATP-binding protein n=1 Tax=Oceanithermus sp. TaxID=2268145 RepID=UPI0025D6C1B1|nr:sugar ABC transporter ATP-binding protein [Oceanithermus sp.]
MKPSPLLETRNLTKVFPGVVALDDVSLTLNPGEVLGLVGENGAGKSTLMKLIGGVYAPTRGQIRLDGREVQFRSPKDALDAGISIVYQELNLIPHLSVAENIFINRLPRRGSFVDWGRLYRQTREILESSGMQDIDPRAIVADLPIGVKQSVEIAKALSYDARVLLLDEPTSSLTGPEIENLFRVIRRLQQQGIGIVYVSHHLDEIFEITDRIHVLRDGKTVAVMPTAEATEEVLVAKMVGRDIQNIYYKGDHRPGEVVLEARGLSDGFLKDVDFKLRRSEVVGIYGLLGSGRTELLKAMVGARPVQAGELKLRGRAVRMRHPQDAIRQGMVYSSEDRKGENLFFGNPIWKNITYLAIQVGHFVRMGFTRVREERSAAERYAKKLNVKAPSVDVDVYHLSGGNQQKVCLAKALITDPDVILLDEPTRGIDVGAKLEIYRLIADLADQGKAVVFVSSELPEVIGCADRVYTMSEGRITAELVGDAINEENVLKYCLQVGTTGEAAS